MRVIGRINYLEPVQSVSHRHTSRSCSPAAFALSSSAASVSGLIPFRAADAKRAQAPTLSFSSVGVSSWWLDNIHNVSVLGDHFD